MSFFIFLLQVSQFANDKIKKYADKHQKITIYNPVVTSSKSEQENIQNSIILNLQVMILKFLVVL